MSNKHAKSKLSQSKFFPVFPDAGNQVSTLHKSVSTIVSEFPAQPSEEFNHSLLVCSSFAYGKYMD